MDKSLKLFSFARVDQAAEAAQCILLKYDWLKEIPLYITYFNNQECSDSISSNVKDFQADILPYLFDLDSQEGAWEWNQEDWGIIFDESEEIIDEMYINPESYPSSLWAGSGLTCFQNTIFGFQKDMIFCFLKRTMYEQDSSGIIDLVRHKEGLPILERGICPTVIVTIGEKNDIEQ